MSDNMQSLPQMRRKRFSGPSRNNNNNRQMKGKPQQRQGGGYRNHQQHQSQDPYAAVPLRKAMQMRDKYLDMAKMTQDRTDAEFWLQHADHYHRIVMYHQANIKPHHHHHPHHQNAGQEGQEGQHDGQEHGVEDHVESEESAEERSPAAVQVPHSAYGTPPVPFMPITGYGVSSEPIQNPPPPEDEE